MLRKCFVFPLKGPRQFRRDRDKDVVRERGELRHQAHGRPQDAGRRRLTSPGHQGDQHQPSVPQSDGFAASAQYGAQ